MDNRKYGLQLRGPAAKKAAKPVLAPFFATQNDDDDDDEDSVDRQLAREAARNKKLKAVEEQHKRALEQDPNAFDYDEVYDDLKAQQARPLQKHEKKAKYIPNLLKTREERERNNELVFERRQEKERAKDDHLYRDKEKFITRAYKEKLAERDKWLHEEEMRDKKERAEDVTKRADITDFYFNLEKNVAFGADVATNTEDDPSKKRDCPKIETVTAKQVPKVEQEATTAPASPVHADDKSPVRVEKVDKQQEQQVSAEETRKLKEAAARERYLARKKARLASS